ncbi:MAG: glycosyltransferase family 9 protein [Lewinellaceae bacterium]|nr:glycosyltransferase family 9 protein [Lewinellaceae bacterium]
MIFFRFFIGIRSGFGWQHSRVLFFRKIQEKYLRYADERQRLNGILERNGVVKRRKDQFPFHIENHDRQKVGQVLEQVLYPELPAIGMVVGAKRPQNRWPVSYFNEVVRHFSSTHNIYLFGGPEDQALVKPLIGHPNVYSFCGTLTPVQTGLFMQKCHLILSNDTGPMHIAYAFGAPVVAIFSNRDFPGRWYPPDESQHTVIRAKDIACTVCLSETCGDNICMKKIAPADVIEKIEAYMTVMLKPELP